MKRLILLVCIALLSISIVTAVEVQNFEIYELGDNGFVVGWELDEAATGQVLFGTTGRLGQQSSIESATLNEHVVQVTGVNPGTVYFFRVVGQTVSGEQYVSSIGVTRTTGGGSDSNTDSGTDTPITNIRTEIVDGGFDVEWDAQGGLTGQVEYGTTQNLGTLTPRENNYLTYHKQRPRGLQATTYYFSIIGVDRQGNIYRTTPQAIDLSGNTIPQPDPTPDPQPDPQPDPTPNPDPDTSGSSIALPSYGSADYYVSTSGSSSNNGRSTSSPWSLQHALNNANPGDTVFVRAGDYGNVRLTQSRSGTANAYINFIGTDSNWNPIDSSQTGRTFTRGYSIDPNRMPLLRGVFTGDNRGQGNGITSSGNYVRFENFQITRYERGMVLSGSHQIIKNVYVYYNGDFRPDLEGGFANYNGWGIDVFGDHITMVDTMVQDVGVQAITIFAEQGRYDNILIYGTNTLNDMDYYFLLTGGANNNYATNIEIYRENGLSHLGHGIVLKPVGNGAFTMNNVIEDFEIVNTNLELQFAGTRDNTVRNGVIYRDTQPHEWSTAITFSNGASRNLLEDIEVRDSYAGILFNDWDDGAADESGGDLASAGFDNTFRRITVKNSDSCVFFRDQGSNGVALNNRIEDSTFDGCSNFIRVRRPNSGTIFDNIQINNIGRAVRNEEGFSLNSNTVFNGVGLVNSFSPSDLSSYQDTNVATGTRDIPTSAPPSQTPPPQAPPPVQPPSSDTAAPVVTSIEHEEVTANSFRVEWRLNEGATGRIEYGTTQNLGTLTGKENSFLDFHRQGPNGLQASTTYYYRVIGEDAAGNAYTSSTRTVTTAAQNTAPPSTPPPSTPPPSPQPNPGTTPGSSINLPNYGSADYYVSTSGSSSNSGRSTSSPWSLQHAMNNANPGDTIFVRAGDYGNIRVTQSRSGTANAYINIIGTDSNWNPINSASSGRTFNRGSSLDPNRMPLLRGVLTGNTGDGTGVTISGNYVRMENFQITRYQTGMNINGRNAILRNLYVTHNGDFRPGYEGGFDNYEGWGINVRGDNVIMVDTMVQDAGAQGITVSAAQGRYDNILVYGSNTDNDIDYYFLLSNGAENNLVTDLEIYRQAFLSHLGHGIVTKPEGGPAQNNVVDGFTITNTNLEVQFSQAQYNTYKNGLITRTTQPPEWSATIQVANGAHHNTFEDIAVRGVFAGVTFNNWEEGWAQGDGFSAGHDNVFRRLDVDDVQMGVYFGTHGAHKDGVAENNKFYDSTFTDTDQFIRTLNRRNSGTEFHNIVIENTGRFKTEGEGDIINRNTVFNGVVLRNSFSASELTPYVESNIRTG